jgi:hypothetical protein
MDLQVGFELASRRDRTKARKKRAWRVSLKAPWAK